MNNHINDSAEILKLVEISRLYYERDLPQAEMAKRMNISRPAVSKLLQEARLRGIVKNDIVIRIALDDFERIDKVFLIGGGKKKIIAIRGTLKTGLVNHLITDEKTAQTVIEMH